MKLPPVHCAPHSMMCPATIPAATRSQSFGRPAELEHHRRERHGGIGDTSGDDDVRAALERLHDAAGAEIRVGRQNPRANVGERLACIHVDERLARREQLVDVRETDRRR